MKLESWQCPQCGTWMRPDVTEHKCTPDGGVSAEVPAPAPSQPPATVTMTHPWQWWAANTTASGASAVTFTFPSAKDLAYEVTREMRHYQEQNPHGPSLAAINEARRARGRAPWRSGEGAA